jgi:hypothetical protein
MQYAHWLMVAGAASRCAKMGSPFGVMRTWAAPLKGLRSLSPG